MNILAIDTATEHCSVTLLGPQLNCSRNVATARSHADLILPLIDEVLTASRLQLSDIDLLAFGRGPGSFTGVRIGVGVIQGLSLARKLPVVGISNLAAVAQRAVLENRLAIGAHVIVCMDARMHEVYWAVYRVAKDNLVELIGTEQVSQPSEVIFDPTSTAIGVGTGWRAYVELREKFSGLEIADGLLPRAAEIALLARSEFSAGRQTDAAGAQPVYIRDRVVAESR